MNELEIRKGADFSICKKYRYALWREWDKNLPCVGFVGLNPSTADDTTDDPTIKRVMAIAHYNGYGSIFMFNLFPLVSTDPRALEDFFNTPFHDIEDSNNEIKMRAYAKANCKDIVFAWGNFKQAQPRYAAMCKMFPNAKAIFLNKNGSPKHPLYCPKNSPFIPFNNERTRNT